MTYFATELRGDRFDRKITSAVSLDTLYYVVWSLGSNVSGARKVVRESLVKTCDTVEWIEMVSRLGNSQSLPLYAGLLKDEQEWRTNHFAPLWTHWGLLIIRWATGSHNHYCTEYTARVRSGFALPPQCHILQTALNRASDGPQIADLAYATATLQILYYSPCRVTQDCGATSRTHIIILSCEIRVPIYRLTLTALISQAMRGARVGAICESFDH